MAEGHHSRPSSEQTGRTHILAAVLVAAALATLGVACSSSDSSGRRDSTTARQDPSSTVTVTVTVAPGTSLGTPEPAADGNFPSVASPKRDGTLKTVKVKLTKVAKVKAPTTLVARPGHADQLFIAERSGRVVLAKRSSNGTGQLQVAKGALLDLRTSVSTDGEQGLLGLAFDRSGNILYVSYNNRNGDTRVDALTVAEGDGAPTLSRRRNVLSAYQPSTTNHKGGDLQLGPDGMLYLGLGDGGGQGDPDQRAQDPTQLLGKLLRIDPTRQPDGKPYAIPAGNSFTGMEGAPEVWMTGLRNPWRFSFDAKSGDLWIGDVGQNEIEEIDRIPAGHGSGLNLGWSGFEGTRVYEPTRIRPGTIPPVFEMDHSSGVCAVTGGVVYRGRRIAKLSGAYLFSDLCRPGINALRASTPNDEIGAVTDERTLSGTSGAREIIAFGTDADQEVYALSLSGEISRLDPA